MRLNTLKGQVEQVLRDNVESRNSDITLMLEIWRRFYPQRIRTNAQGKEGVYLQDIYDLPREDNVKRIRAKFQNHKTTPQYLPTELAIVKARKINEDLWKKHLGYMPSKKEVKYVLDPVNRKMKLMYD